MIWATVSSRSYFCWLYTASSSSATKKCTQFDFVIGRLVMSMCYIISHVVEKRCWLWPVHSISRIQLAFDLLHFVLQRQTCLLLQVSLDFLLLHSNSQWWIAHLFLVLVLGGLLGLLELISFFGISDRGIDLNYYDVARLALETNQDHYVLRLHPGSKFWTLLMTMRATPCLLWDSCPQ